jgi:hypothetical protein
MCCSICWEDTKESCILLQNNIFSDSIKNYRVICSCNIVIHKTCMNKWTKKDKSCPICRKLLYEYQSLCLYTLNTIKNIIVNIFFLVSIIYFILILYFIILLILNHRNLLLYNTIDNYYIFN